MMRRHGGKESQRRRSGLTRRHRLRFRFGEADGWSLQALDLPSSAPRTHTSRHHATLSPDGPPSYLYPYLVRRGLNPHAEPHLGESFHEPGQCKDRVVDPSSLTQFGSESLPTLALLTFLVLQFLFNIVRFLPVQSLKLWVDRSRFLWKTLLDVS